MTLARIVTKEINSSFFFITCITIHLHESTNAIRVHVWACVYVCVCVGGAHARGFQMQSHTGNFLKIYYKFIGFSRILRKMKKAYANDAWNFHTRVIYAILKNERIGEEIKIVRWKTRWFSFTCMPFFMHEQRIRLSIESQAFNFNKIYFLIFVTWEMVSPWKSPDFRLFFFVCRMEFHVRKLFRCECTASVSFNSSTTHSVLVRVVLLPKRKWFSLIFMISPIFNGSSSFSCALDTFQQMTFSWKLIAFDGKSDHLHNTYAHMHQFTQKERARKKKSNPNWMTQVSSAYCFVLLL